MEVTWHRGGFSVYESRFTFRLENQTPPKYAVSYALTGACSPMRLEKFKKPARQASIPVSSFRNPSVDPQN
ncbi:unnamed protein product [Cuscuta campestris]|uniref:Uncharacterized protein n=1 Tax=Cuscuta campestris TaxID=132261 RepID=A0A484MLS1_9ASTE|nr:unnamed protein product [Cuscuta campestris]